MLIRNAFSRVGFVFCILFADARIVCAEEFWGCKMDVKGDLVASMSAMQFLGKPHNSQEMMAAIATSVNSTYWAAGKQISTPKNATGVNIRGQRYNSSNPLTVGCSGSIDPGFNFDPGLEVTYEQIPFKPGTYALTQDPNSGLKARVHLHSSTGQKLFGATSGTLKINKFDMHEVQGDFTFSAVELDQLGRYQATGAPHAKTIQVTGAFHFHCLGRKCN